jgi:hypothetical protein
MGTSSPINGWMVQTYGKNRGTLGISVSLLVMLRGGSSPLPSNPRIKCFIYLFPNIILPTSFYYDEGRVYVFQYTVTSPPHMVEKNDVDLMMMGNLSVKVTYWTLE